MNGLINGSDVNDYVHRNLCSIGGTMIDYKTFIELAEKLEIKAPNVMGMINDLRNENCLKCGEYKWNYMKDCKCKGCRWND